MFQTMDQNGRGRRFYIARWAVGGAFFGVGLVLVAWRLGVAELGDVTFAELHAAMPTMWIVDLTPTLLGLTGAVIGVLHQNLRRSHDHVEELARELAAVWTSDLQSSNEQLATALGERVKFYAALTHELRTPLSSILGYSDLVRALEIEPDEATEYVSEICNSASFLLDMVNDLLSAAKHTHNGLKVSAVEVDATKVALEVMALLRPLAESKGLELRADLADSAVCLADPVRLRQVITNVMANAIKYSRSGVITITTSAGAGNVLVEVADQGDGLAPDDIDRIFLPFVEAHGNDRQDSTGLGLAVSKAFVEAMNGTMTARSDGPGKGASFRIVLPASEPADLQREPDAFIDMPVH